MKKNILWLLPLLFAGMIFSGCSPRAKYEHRLKHELSSGVRHDSLFLGLYLGMPEKDFYTHSWMLNRQGLIKQGPSNMSVEYKLKDQLKYPATMNYYPVFVENKIFEMPVRFVYNGWSPWNKKFSSDSLEADVLRWYKETYGKGFIKVAHPERGLAYVKVDGNRRITIFKTDDLHVWAVFTDMLVKREKADTSEAGIIHNDITKDLEKRNVDSK